MRNPVTPEAGTTQPTMPMAAIASSSEGENARCCDPMNFQERVDGCDQQNEYGHQCELKKAQVQSGCMHHGLGIRHPQVDEDHRAERNSY